MSNYPNDFPHLTCSQLLNQGTDPNQSSSSTPATQFGQGSGQNYSQQYNPLLTPQQIYNQQLAFHQNQLSPPQYPPSHYPPSPYPPSQYPPSQQVPETQFNVPQSQPPQRRQNNTGRGKGKWAAKKAVAVDLSADDDDIDAEDDVEFSAPQRWSPDEEKLLAEVWVGVSEDIDRGNDQTEEFFWNTILEDFNGRNLIRRSKNMLTGKWSRSHPDVQKFHAIFKSLKKGSGENEDDVIEAAKLEFAACNNGKKFTLDHMWRVLRDYSKWNAPEGLDENDHSNVFAPDATRRPPDKQRPAKKTRSETTGSSTGSGSTTSKEEINEALLRKLNAGKDMYESRRAKADAEMEFKELEFLSIRTDDLPEPQKSIIIRKQSQIAAKYQL